MARHTISQRIRSVVVAHDDGVVEPIRLKLLYSPSEPYAVTLEISNGKQVVPWEVSRDMLKVGLRRRVGEGDVTVRPYFDDPEDFSRPCMTHISLRSDDGACTLRFPAAELEAFLTHTFELVAQGAESERLDLDATIRGIFRLQGRAWFPVPCGDDNDLPD